MFTGIVTLENSEKTISKKVPLWKAGEIVEFRHEDCKAIILVTDYGTKPEYFSGVTLYSNFKNSFKSDSFAKAGCSLFLDSIDLENE